MEVENEPTQDATSLDRRNALGLLGAGIAAVSLQDSGLARTSGKAPRPLLGTPDQIAGEKMVMQLCKEPEVIRLQAQLKAELLQGPIGKTPAGAATVDGAIEQWTRSQAFKEIGWRRQHPTVLWITDDTPRTWFGYTLGGVGMSGDNPEHIYRGAIIDGAKNYEVLGWKDQTRPSEMIVVQFDKATINPASQFDMKSKMPSIVSATQALFKDDSLMIAPDGSFRITVGSGEQGPVHVTLPGPGTFSISFRDLLANWLQRPTKIVVSELGSGRPIDIETPEPLDVAMLKQHLLEDLPGYVQFWAKFPEIWFGGLQPNTISAPRGRVGGWGFVAGLHFALTPDEAAIVTITRGDAVYTGFQINDPWMIQANVMTNQNTLNNSQSKPGPDGSYTYVISQQDPGVANWLDTNGVNSGIGLIRWQKVPAGMTGDGLIREYRVVKLADVAAMTDLPRVTPAERKAAIAERAATYATRTT